MYEILIKLENDLKEQKYTLENLKELKELLNDLKTKEVKIKKIKKWGVTNEWIKCRWLCKN